MPGMRTNRCCCAMVPPADCTNVDLTLTNVAVDDLNTTDWDAGTGVLGDGDTTGEYEVIAADSVRMTDVTLTHKDVSVGTHAAYYVQFTLEDFSTGASLKIHHGTDVATFDLNLEKIVLNSQPDSPMPPSITYTWDSTQLLSFLTCPTHLMAEIKTTGTAGTTAVDEKAVTVTQAFKIEAVGTIQITGVTFYPAEVAYSGTTLVTDCGREDLFPCHYPWVDGLPVDADHTTQSVDLTVVGDVGPGLAAGFTRIWYPLRLGGFLTRTTVTGEPVDNQGPNTPTEPNCIRYADHEIKQEVPGSPGDWYIYDRAKASSVWLGVRMEAEVYRPAHSSSVPYPVPQLKSTLTGTKYSSGTTVLDTDTAELDMDIPDVISTPYTQVVTLEAGDPDESEITWEYPYV